MIHLLFSEINKKRPTLRRLEPTDYWILGGIVLLGSFVFLFRLGQRPLWR